MIRSQSPRHQKTSATFAMLFRLRQLSSNLFIARFADLANNVSFSFTSFILRFSDRPKLKLALHFPYIQNSFYDKLDPVPRVNSCPRGFCCYVKLDTSYQLSKIAEILWVNQQGALKKQLHPGR